MPGRRRAPVRVGSAHIDRLGLWIPLNWLTRGAQLRTRAISKPIYRGAGTASADRSVPGDTAISRAMKALPSPVKWPFER